MWYISLNGEYFGVASETRSVSWDQEIAGSLNPFSIVLSLKRNG